MPLKLGVNIDHVATLRQARYALLPDSPNAEPVLVEAALEVEKAGADSITIHLRADRRHIQDRDVSDVAAAVSIPINFEMGNTPEIVDIALAQKPEYVCLVPEIREEITTEGGLDVVGNREALRQTVEALQKNGTSVSMFIDPEPEQVEASSEIGARMIELHTGAYANATGQEAADEVTRLAEAARQGHGLGLQINAGHGINQANIEALYQVPHMVELNIGHHLVSRAVFVGLQQSIVEMRALMDGYPESF